MDLPAALDHQVPEAAGVKVLEDPLPDEYLAGGDHVGEIAECGAGLSWRPQRRPGRAAWPAAVSLKLLRSLPPSDMLLG